MFSNVVSPVQKNRPASGKMRRAPLCAVIVTVPLAAGAVNALIDASYPADFAYVR